MTTQTAPKPSLVETGLSSSTTLLGILVAGLILRMLFIGADGYRGDVSSFMSWAITVAGNPLPDFYSKAGFADYPPGYLLVLWLVGKAYAAFVALHHGANDFGFLKYLVKLPAVICDLLDGWLIYLIARRFASEAWANGAAALFVLNPVTIYISAYWGQVDSVPAAFLLGAVVLILYSTSRPPVQQRLFVTGAWLSIGYAILIKPPAVMLALLMVAWAFATSDRAERTGRLIATAIGAAASFVMAYALGLLFHPDFITAIGWLIERYRYGSAVYAYNSVNAFNLHSVVRPFWQPDTGSVSIGPIDVGPMWLWGIVLVGAATTLILVRYFQRRDEGAFLEAAMLLSLAFFMLATRMHERYVYNAFVLMIPLAVVARRYLICALVLSVTIQVNLWYSLAYAQAMEAKLPINGADMWPLITHPLSLLNVAVFFWLGYIFLGAKAPDPAEVPEDAPVRERSPMRAGFADRLGALAGRVWFAPSEGLAGMTRIDWLIVAGFAVGAFVLDFVRYWVPADRYFDEIYYPRSGIEYLKDARINTDWEFPFEWTHPPLTKLLIAASIWMFGGVAHGDTGWGWRFLNIVCGTLIIPLLYIFAKRLMASTLFSTIAAFMMTFDGFRFVQARIATPEIWVATATLGVLYAFYRLWIAAQVRVRINIPQELGVRFWSVFGFGTVLAIAFSIFINSFGATPATANSYGVAFVYAELGFYLLARWVGRRFSAAGPSVTSYAEGSRVVSSLGEAEVVRWDGGGTGTLALDGLDLNYHDDGTLEYATSQDKARFTPAGAMEAEGGSVKPADARTWAVVLCIAMALLASSKWNGLFDFFVVWVAIAIVMLQRFLPVPAVLGNPRGFTPDQLVGSMLFVTATVYGLCYLPNYHLGYNLADIVGMQQQMYWYHSQLSKTNPASLNHPYGSYWWQWPTLFAPISYYWNDTRVGAQTQNAAACCVAEILALPNPLVWWLGLFSVPAIAWWGFVERNKGYLLLATAYLFHWLPWILTPRIAFEYHFFPNLAIIVLANAIVLQRWWAKRENRPYIGVYLAGVLACFIFFYPILAAVPITYSDWHSRMWLDNWLDLLPGHPHPHGLSWIKPN